MYGENLPREAINGAHDIISRADCLIVCGTSLLVEPAASFISGFQGENLIIINREITPYNKYAKIVFQEDMNMLFEKLYNELN